jgi:hypothetical protein
MTWSAPATGDVVIKLLHAVIDRVTQHEGEDQRLLRVERQATFERGDPAIQRVWLALTHGREIERAAD